LCVEIVDPINHILSAKIDKLSDCVYEITYWPILVGIHKIILKWNEKELIGSPFLPNIVNTNKIKVYDAFENQIDNNKVEIIELNTEKIFNFDTSEAGLGKSLCQ
jgi:hypothetical protein